jgi:thymidine kinase
MNAGKTTTLLQSNYNYIERGMKTKIFLPEIIGNTVKSRIGLKQEGIPFSTSFDFSTVSYTHINCILVDEAQFLTRNQVLQLSQISHTIPVLCYGIRTDFRGEPFEGSKYLLALADILTEIKTICKCGKKATMNQRIDQHGDVVLYGQQVEIGGNDKYIAVCRKCFQT